MKPARTIAALSLSAACCVTAAGAATIVPGSANPNLAGRALGYSCCSGDIAPAQSPPLIEVDSCSWLRFTVSGRVSYEPGAPVGNNPDGDEVFDMTNYGDGIARALKVRTNALVGVFLDDQSPTGLPTPLGIDFSGSRDSPFIGPGLRQIFFIGDGLTSDSAAGQSNGTRQTFVAPFGATRLYLGTVDGTGWANNSGSFTVDMTSLAENRPRPCGDPVGTAGTINTSDALHILRSSVGAANCHDCICDTDQSGGSIAASDALRVLRAAVGVPQELRCLCCCCPED